MLVKWAPAYFVKYYIHKWHVSTQLSCGDTCEICQRNWMDLTCSSKIRYIRSGGIIEGRFSNPRPWLFSALELSLYCKMNLSYIYKLNLSSVSSWFCSQANNEPTNGKSALVQVMAWCRPAPSHYPSQSWPRSLSQYIWDNTMSSRLWRLSR